MHVVLFVLICYRKLDFTLMKNYFWSNGDNVSGLEEQWMTTDGARTLVLLAILRWHVQLLGHDSFARDQHKGLKVFLFARTGSLSYH